MDEDIYVPFVPFVIVVTVVVVVVVHHHHSIQSRSTRDIHPRAEGLIWILDFRLKMTNHRDRRCYPLERSRGRSDARGAWVVRGTRMVSTTSIYIQIITNVYSRVQEY